METKNIVSGYFDDRGTPRSEAARVTERFTLGVNETKLDLEATLIDPETLTEPVSLRTQHFEWAPGDKIKPFNCSASEQL